MRDAEESDGCGAELDDLVALHFADVDGHGGREFLLALLDHLGGEAPRVDRGAADAIDDVGNAADVVEVAVADQEAAYFIPPLFEVSRVG